MQPHAPGQGAPQDSVLHTPAEPFPEISGQAGNQLPTPRHDDDPDIDFSSDPKIFEERLRTVLGPRSAHVLTLDVCDEFTDVFREQGALAAQRFFLQQQQHYDLLMATAEMHMSPTNKVRALTSDLRIAIMNLSSLKGFVLSDPALFDEHARTYQLPFQRSHILLRRYRRPNYEESSDEGSHRGDSSDDSLPGGSDSDHDLD